MSINLRREVAEAFRRRGVGLLAEAKSLGEMAGMSIGRGKIAESRSIGREAQRTDVEAKLCLYLANMIEPRKNKSQS